MLPKRKRLTTKEVAAVLSRGRSLHSSRSPVLLSAKYVAVEGPFKIAVVVSKSLAKKATVRNSLRRAVYEAIAMPPLPSSGAHVLFFVRSIPQKPRVPAFREEIAVLLKKL